MSEIINPMRMVSENDPEEKEYLILMYLADDNGDEDMQIFEFVIGRTATYQYIKDMIDGLDIEKSKVIVKDVTINDALTVHQFMYLMKEKYYTDDSFNIEDYVL